MKQLLIITTFLITSILSMNAQRARNWRFGEFASLNFNPNPTSSLGSSMLSNSGCASISSTTGNLLFYTNGDQVWDNTNTVMSGTPALGIGGSEFAVQSAIIIPKPESVDSYYVFTNGIAGGNFSYSVVRMSLNGGLGAVASSNNVLMLGTSGRVAAIEACDGKSVWVVTHKDATNEFYAYRVTSSGISAPVISDVPTVGSFGFYYIGALKFSPNRLKLAMTEAALESWILEFDPALGTVYNPLALNTPGYGISFSSRSSRLYVSSDGNADVYQFNADALTPAALLASKTNISLTTTGSGGSLQLGSNGRIYVDKYQTDSIDVINSPNQLGFACNYQVKDLGLVNPTRSTLGLPIFAENYVAPNRQETYATFIHNLCNGVDTVKIPLLDVGSNVTYEWNFGEPASGANNLASTNMASHTFNTMGTYTVTVIISGECRKDTEIAVVNTGSLSIANPQADINYCVGSSGNIGVAFNATVPINVVTYSWLPTAGLANSNAANTAVTTSTDATYTVTVKAGVCIAVDSINVTVKPLPNLAYYPKDTLYCTPGALVQLTASGAAFYNWGPVGAPPTINCTVCPNPKATPTSSTIYTVTGTGVNGCSTTGTLSLNIAPLNALFVKSTTNPNNTPADEFCLGNGINLSAFYSSMANPKLVYDLGNGVNTTKNPLSNYIYPAAGNFKVIMRVYDTLGCEKKETWDIFVDDSARSYLAVNDSMPCLGERVYFKDSVSPFAQSFTLEYGDSSPKVTSGHNTNHLYLEVNTYEAVLIENHKLCPDSTTKINVKVKGVPAFTLGKDTVICPGFTQPLILGAKNWPNNSPIWKWNTGDSASKTIFANTPGDYYLTITNENGCVAADTITIIRDCFVNVPNTFTPNGDGVNDYWIPMDMLASGVNAYNLNIYNRWGEQVFTTTNINSRGWDGKFGGKDQPMATYVYQLTYVLKNGIRNTSTGNFTLIR